MSTLSATFDYDTRANIPGSPREGHHFFVTDEGILLRYDGSAWQAVSHIRGLPYVFSTTTSDADPGAGTLRFNNATPASVTAIYIDDVCLGSDADLGTVFDALSGARLLITQANDPAKYLLVEVTADADGTGYWQLTATVDASGTLPDNGALLSVQIIGGGGGGGGTTRWWNTPQANVISWWAAHDGDIVQQFGQTPALTGGSTDADGQSGLGSFSEDEVGCSVVGDISPGAGGQRGYEVNDQDIRPDTGMYFRTSVRVAEENDQHIIVGLSSAAVNAFDDTGLVNTSVVAAFVKREADANWQAAVNDGATNQTYQDTGVAWATGTWYNMEIYLYDDGGTMTAEFYIDGTLVHTATANCPPASNNFMRPLIQSRFLTTGATGTYDQVMFTNGMFWACEDSGILSAKGWA